MKRDTEDGYQRTNREMSQEPRSKGWWCFGCDANHVSSGQKCEVCKSRMAGSRGKPGKPIVRE